jgi:hypothetical protein
VREGGKESSRASNALPLTHAPCMCGDACGICFVFFSFPNDQGDTPPPRTSRLWGPARAKLSILARMARGSGMMTTLSPTVNTSGRRSDSSSSSGGGGGGGGCCCCCWPGGIIIIPSMPGPPKAGPGPKGEGPPGAL